MISFECEVCGADNHIEVPIEECDSEFDVTVIAGHVKLVRFENHVQLSLGDWEKINAVWKEYHANLGRN